MRRSKTVRDVSNPQGPDFDFGASPILRTLPNGRRVLTAGQKSGVAWGLDPDKEGAVLWEHRIGKGSVTGGIEWGGAADEQVVYYTNNDSFVGPRRPADWPRFASRPENASG